MKYLCPFLSVLMALGIVSAGCGGGGGGPTAPPSFRPSFRAQEIPAPAAFGALLAIDDAGNISPAPPITVPPLPEGLDQFPSEAYSRNRHGIFVGVVYSIPGDEGSAHGLVVEGDKAYGIGGIFEGVTIPYSINDNNDVVGMSVGLAFFYHFGQPERAFNLNLRSITSGIPSGITLTRGVAISNSGLVLAEGYDGQNGEHWFLLTPTTRR